MSLKSRRRFVVFGIAAAVASAAIGSAALAAGTLLNVSYDPSLRTGRPCCDIEQRCH